MKELGALYQYLRRNINGLADQLAIAYNVELAPSLERSELQRLREKVIQIESLVLKKGGSLVDLRNAIAAGANSPVAEMQLGAVVAAASTTAASGFIATIVAFLKDVDWGKLIKKAPKALETAKGIKDGINDLKNNSSNSGTAGGSSSPTASGNNSAGSSKTPENASPTKYAPTASPNDNNPFLPAKSKQAGMNKALIISGVALIAAGGFYLYKKKQAQR